MPRSRLVGIAGAPATGKKTLGTALAALMGCRHATVLELAREMGAVLGFDAASAEYVVDTDVMRSRMELEPPRGLCALSGVLVPAVLPRSRALLVVVLRSSPAVLLPRYLERGYPPDKIRDNLLAEALGVTLDEALRVYGEGLVHEVDATARDPSSLAAEVRDVASGFRPPSLMRLDWLDVCERDPSLRSACFPEVPRGLDRARPEKLKGAAVTKTRFVGGREEILGGDIHAHREEGGGRAQRRPGPQREPPGAVRGAGRGAGARRAAG
ncbi:MAG: adenylate kinase family protein, partial [Conexivisphaera sp.]